METKQITEFTRIELSKGKNLQSYGSLNDPYFLAKDVADLIGHTDVSKMCSRLDEEEKLIRTIFGSDQRRDMLFVTEDGLYEILMTSRTKFAKLFKKEIKKVLKSLRVNGGYIVGQSGIDQESFNKAVADRTNCVVSSAYKERDFWRSVAESQQKRIVELESAFDYEN